MKKKGKVAWIVAAMVAVMAGVGLGCYCGVVRAESKRYNLVTLKAEGLPERVAAAEEGDVQLSEVRMHYVRYGEGAQPVVLIHGNAGDKTALAELAGYLDNDYTVYCIESRCHGQSSDPGEISYESMARDVAEFIDAKMRVKPFVLGHSDGGIVAITLAANHPDKVAAIVPCGANSHPKRFKWYFTLAIKVKNLFKKDKLNDLMLTLPDFTPEYLARIHTPAYVVAGEYDIMPLADTVYIHEHIAESKIAIVKGANHSSYVSKRNGGKIYQIAKPFFDEQAQCVPLG